ncbi:MAG: hypothetical protein MUO70_05840 [Euryarchaeota archaeon]|nr:hypothetical protein [Euryarchaeota archaeon]
MKYGKRKVLSVLILLAASSLVAGSVITPAAAQPTPGSYYVPQAGSTWVNHGTTGASYNAYVSTPGLFRTQSNGHPYWGDMGQNDYISIPAGSATNNQNTASWEIGFHYAGMTGQRFQKIWDKAYGAYMIEIDTYKGPNEGYLTIYRATTGGSGARWYIPMDTVLRTGHNYYVQIAWDSRAGPGNEKYPTIWIGEDGNAPVRQTRWDETGGALEGTGSWYNDAAGPANLGNTASGNGVSASVKTAWLNGGFFVYRQYNSIVDFSSGGSWSTDKLAWTATTPTIKPTATPAPKVTPTQAVKPTVKATATPPVKAAVKPTVKATAIPTVKATATLKTTPTVKATAIPMVKATATLKTTPTVKATAIPMVKAAVSSSSSDPSAIISASLKNDSVPGISVPSAQTSGVASLPAKPVSEFSLLGLGIPALLAGLVYLLIRR